jgi:acyl-CoA reductase-like NAD-dependent aldehyde dehydrogenase
MTDATTEPTAEPKATPFPTESPVDGSPLASVTATAASDVPDIVAKARAAQSAWAQKSVRERAAALVAVRDRILDRAQEFAKSVHLETGKPEVEALLAEVLPTADVVEFWTDSIEELLDATDVELDRFVFGGKSGVIYREARGVVALITPWNYPVALPLRTLVPALLAGNAVVWKPSEIAPRAGKLVYDLFEGLVPKGVLELVQGGDDLGAVLAAAEVDFVVFTGSVATGRKVAHACAERVAQCAIELGGKDAAIVLADTDLPRAVSGVVWGALTNAGQSSASIERVYVDAKIAKSFIDAVVAEVKTLRPNLDVGPLTTPAQKETVMTQMAAAKAAGATVLVEGAAQGLALSPSVLRVEDDDSPLMREPTSGPVIAIAIVQDAEEAIRRANASRFGLTASIWTTSYRKAQQMAHRLRAGVVTINNHAFTGALPRAPWGGLGDSGHGVTGSTLALEGLTRPRFVLTDRSRKRRELWWYPYTPALTQVALAMVVLRSGTRGIFAKVAAFFRLLGGVLQRFSS